MCDVVCDCALFIWCFPLILVGLLLCGLLFWLVPVLLLPGAIVLGVLLFCIVLCALAVGPNELNVETKEVQYTPGRTRTTTQHYYGRVWSTNQKPAAFSQHQSASIQVSTPPTEQRPIGFVVPHTNTAMDVRVSVDEPQTQPTAPPLQQRNEPPPPYEGL